MRKFASSFIVTLLLLGCQTSGQRQIEPEVNLDNSRIWIKGLSKSDTLVEVEFHADTLNYGWFVQEINYDDGLHLIECFKDDGDICDRHSWAGAETHGRSMTVYAADVEGVDATSGGFAHLPDNGFGKKTNIGPKFNEWYQSEYKTQGCITRRSAFEVKWRIAVVDGKAKVSGSVAWTK